jgi:hypothetical protein
MTAPIATPDPFTLVGTYWPLDGSADDPEHLLAAAGVVAELVRWTNHATQALTNSALPRVPDVYPALDRLADAAAQLAQLTRQLGAWTVKLSEDAGLRHCSDPTNHGRASEAALAAAESLATASGYAEQLSNAINAAAEQLANVYQDQPGRG